MFLPNGFEALSLTPAEDFRLSIRVIEIIAVVGGLIAIHFGIFSSRRTKLQTKGLDLQLSGNPQAAEKCFRAALDKGANAPKSDRVRLLVGLSDTLIDQKRYDEAKQYLTQALELGDPTGSGQGSMCDLLLAQKVTPEKAIEMADEAFQLQTRTMKSMSFGARWANVSNELLEAKTWARKAQAYLITNRQSDAHQAMDRSLQILNAAMPEFQQASPEAPPAGKLALGDRLRRLKYLTISDTCWTIGLSLLAMGDTAKAREQFLLVRDSDPMGKYRALAQGEINSLGKAEAEAQIPKVDEVK